MGFNVDHSKLIRLSFCYVLSWFANITNSKPNKLIIELINQHPTLEVGILKNINQLDVSENKLTGEIPRAISDCLSFEYLYLQGNLFQGTLTPSLASLRGLQFLDLSQNNLSMSIPKDLQKLSLLQYLNLSFNNLEGEVPTEGIFRNASNISVNGNKKLCGGIPELLLQAFEIKVMKEGNPMLSN